MIDIGTHCFFIQIYITFEKILLLYYLGIDSLKMF